MICSLKRTIVTFVVRNNVHWTFFTNCRVINRCLMPTKLRIGWSPLNSRNGKISLRCCAVVILKIVEFIFLWESHIHFDHLLFLAVYRYWLVLGATLTTNAAQLRTVAWGKLCITEQHYYPHIPIDMLGIYYFLFVSFLSANFFLKNISGMGWCRAIKFGRMEDLGG